MDNFVQNSVNSMSEFVQNNIYKDFIKPKCEIIFDESKRPGNAGGFIVQKKKQIPYIRICKWTIRGYLNYGFTEYVHISKDLEIGSIKHLRHWKECLSAVLTHEMAHVVEMGYEEFMVPELYHSYSTDNMYSEYEEQKQYHGRNWQYFYRILRNEFVNNRNNWD